MPSQTVILKNFDYIIGVDQTGASYKGVPKKLPLSYFDARTNTLHLGLNLESFNLNSFCKLIENFKQKRVLIIVDAVLGFPAGTKLNIFQVLNEIKDYHDFGKAKAELFFNDLKVKYSISGLPLRTIEQKLNANSVFTPYPFQKNIQTGTYRILKDLSRDQKWYNILPYEDQNFNKYIIEGYPSKAFKDFLNETRSESGFYYFLSSLDIKTKLHSALSLDHIDSAMLALQGLCNINQNQVIEICDKSEGYIL